MGFGDLFLVALEPVLKVLIITGVGSFLALKRIDLLGPSARHHLNNIVYYVFGPAMVASYLAETITMESLLQLWFMPVNILLTFVIGSILAWMLNKIARTPQHLRGLVVGCCSAGNLGNLLLIIIPGVCNESNSPFGDPSLCTASGNAYVSLSMAIGGIYIWSYVYIIMRISINKNINPDKSGENVESSPREISGSSTESSTEPLLPSVVCESNSTVVQLPHEESSEKVSVGCRFKQKIRGFMGEINLKMLFAPSTIAAIFGFTIGTVPLLRNAVIGDDAPLRVVESSIYLLGEACIPALTLIIGANLLKGLRSSGVGAMVVLGIILVRYVALPLIGIVVIKAARSLGLVGADSLYQFILMLQFALPPAMSVGTISQLFEAGESECSVIMLWTYVVAVLSFTLWSTFYMWLVA
ncbi:protein PIN-LIKES 3-like [Punica granatum]|uniref:Protein PIN-LIKES 3-like n=1 Tax=Punica granatum TaxID=22663 RepID=A0A6P8DQF6_PUNGR|nr:protein PIN-LIKES 3-like [Punica granatum]